MISQPDFSTFLALLDQHKVRYMIVGGHAVAYHGYPRFTKDLDIFYCDESSNIRLLNKVLIAFGFRASDIAGDLFDQGNIIKIGVEPVRIDLLNRIDGVRFDSASVNAVEADLGAFTVTMIGLDDLLVNKSSTSRLQDKLDYEKLCAIRSQLKNDDQNLK